MSRPNANLFMDQIFSRITHVKHNISNIDLQGQTFKMIDKDIVMCQTIPCFLFLYHRKQSLGGYL